MTNKSLVLDHLKNGMPGLTSIAGGSLCEAGAVCFEHHKHTIGTTLLVSGGFEESYSVSWPTVTEAMTRTYGDLQEATERGASGVAILLILDLTPFTVVERSVKGTGIDYWLGNEDDLLFQRKARLEVSGILEGNDAKISQRVREKLKQTTSSDGSLPAFVVVVEFGNPKSKVKKK